MLLAEAALRMLEMSISVLGTTMTAGLAVQAAFITFLLSSYSGLEGRMTCPDWEDRSRTISPVQPPYSRVIRVTTRIENKMDLL